MPRTQYQDQPEMLETLLGRKVIFADALRFGNAKYGIATFSNSDIRTINQTELPSKAEQRIFQQICFRFPSQGLRFELINTHFGLTVEDRIAQAEALLTQATTMKVPLIMCGDFNAESGEECIKRIKSTGLLDAGATLGKNTFIANDPKQRIDYIWYSKEFRLLNYETIPTLASDHLAIIADLELSSIE